MIFLTCWAATIAGDDPTATSVYEAGRRRLETPHEAGDGRARVALLR